MYKLMVVACLLLVMLSAATGEALAYAVLTISPEGNAAYTVSANGLQDALSVQFSIKYDENILKNPQVTLVDEANGTVQANSTKGVLNVVLVSSKPFKNSGVLARISFVPVGTAPAVISKVDETSVGSGYTSAAIPFGANLEISKSPYTESGSKVDSPVGSSGKDKNPAVTGNPTNPTSSQNVQDVEQMAQQQQGRYLSGVTVTGNTPFSPETRRDEQRSEERPREEVKYDKSTSYSTPSPSSYSSSGYSAQASSTSPVSAKDAVALLKSFEGPAQRFINFKGTRNLKSMLPLFDTAVARKAGITQTPDLAVSDGQSRISIKIELATAAIVPTFSLKGANLKSIRPVSDKIWELEALPQKGRSDVRLSIFMGSDKVEIPLSVIPPLNDAQIKTAQGLTEAGVSAMLATVSTKPPKPVYDLNGDDRQDFLDDYILIGHYLLNLKKQVKVEKQTQKK